MKTKTKWIATIVIGLSLALSVLLTALLQRPIQTTASTVSNTEWTGIGESNPSATFDDTNKYHIISGMTRRGDRMVHNTKVKLDGLEVEFGSDSVVSGERFGFTFVSNPTDFPPDAAEGGRHFNAIFDINAYAPGQNRLGLATIDDPAEVYSIASQTQGGALEAALCSSKVYNFQNGGAIGARLTFHKENASYYSVSFTATAGDAWGSNIAKVYVAASYIERGADANGYAYLSVYHGWTTDALSSAVKVKYEDDNVRAAMEAIGAYRSAVEAYEASATQANFEAMLNAKDAAAAWAGTVSDLTCDNYSTTLRSLNIRIAAFKPRNIEVTSAYSEYEMATGYHVIRGLTSMTDSVNSAQKVKIDGLQIDLYTNQYKANDRLGFAFVPTNTTLGVHYENAGDTVPYYFNTAIMFQRWAGQTRVAFTTSDSDAYGCIGKDTWNGAINVDAFHSSKVFNYEGENKPFGIRLTFHKGWHTPTQIVYRVDIEQTYGDTTHIEGGPNLTTTYIDQSYFNSAIDANGYAYLSIYGFRGAGNETQDPVLKIKWAEDHSHDDAIAAAEAYVAYGQSIQSTKVNASNYAQAMAARTAAVQAKEEFNDSWAGYATLENMIQYTDTTYCQFQSYLNSAYVAATATVDYNAATIATDATAFLATMETLNARAAACVAAGAATEDGIATAKGEAEAVVAALQLPIFNSVSMILSGKLGVNFYLYLPQSAQVEENFLRYTVKDRTETVSFSEEAVDGYGRFHFIAYVSAIELADTISVDFVYGEGAEDKISTSTSVQTYLNYIVANYNDDKTVNLVKAIADYGHYAQLALAEKNGWEVGVEHAAISAGTAEQLGTSLDIGSEYAVQFAGELEGVSVSSFSISLGYNTYIRIYFTATGDVPTVTVDGTETEVFWDGGNNYHIVIYGIAAHELGTAHTVVFGDSNDITVQLSVVSYIRTLLASSQPDAMKRAVVALYNFYQAAVAYAAA